MQWGMEKWGARREGEEQVMAEEAAFEIFIPCRLMAFSAVDRMEELGRARREEGGRKFSCEWVPPWRAGEREARIYSGRRPQKAITVTTTAETETSGKKGRGGGKNSTEQHNAKRRPRSIPFLLPLLLSLMGWKRRRLFQTNGFPSFAPSLSLSLSSLLPRDIDEDEKEEDGDLPQG